MDDSTLKRRMAALERRLHRARRADQGARVVRLERRHARLQQLLALPPDQRPARFRLDLDVLKTALDAAQLVLAATPVGPVLSTVKLGMVAAKGVQRALAEQDADGAVDGLLGAVRAELSRRGVSLPEDDEAFAVLTEALEDRLDPV